MFGRAYRAGRHMGRMGMDSSQRMSNRAEVGMGCVGLIGVAMVFLLILFFIL